MVIVSRDTGQSIVIGDDIKVILLSVSGKSVRLGFVAPDGVHILQAELVEPEEPTEEETPPPKPKPRQSITGICRGCHGPMKNGYCPQGCSDGADDGRSFD